MVVRIQPAGSGCYLIIDGKTRSAVSRPFKVRIGSIGLIRTPKRVLVRNSVFLLTCFYVIRRLTFLKGLLFFSEN